MLKIHEVSKKFGKKQVLHKTSLTLNKGIIGLLGPNGAGKTTFLRLLSTYYALDMGTILLDELSWSKNLERVRKQIGYLPQHSGGFPDLTAYEYLEYLGVLRGLDMKQLKNDIPLILRDVNLENKANELIKSFSGGMKQRLGIAQAILHNPKLLLVDEPTAGLDPEERIRFRNLIKRLGKDRLVIISTHITEDVAMTCDQILLMQDGRIEQYLSIQDVVNLAKGCVWALETTPATYEEIRQISDVLITQNAQLDKDLVTLRFIAPDSIHSQARPVIPTLEEGYMVWLNKN